MELNLHVVELLLFVLYLHALHEVMKTETFTFLYCSDRDIEAYS